MPDDFPLTDPDIILFDGVCNLCNGLVQFILKRDPRRRFRFASLQSDVGRELMARHGLDPDRLDTVVLLRDGRAHTRSDAAIRILSSLQGGAWRLLRALLIVPRFLRDPVYNLVGRNRYRWFGQQDQCMLPTPENRQRFLDAY